MKQWKWWYVGGMLCESQSQLLSTLSSISQVQEFSKDLKFKGILTENIGDTVKY